MIHRIESQKSLITQAKRKKERERERKKERGSYEVNYINEDWYTKREKMDYVL